MDRTGAAHATPLRRAGGWGWQYGIAAAVLCVGALLSLLLFAELRKQEREDLRHHFARAAGDRVQAIRRTIETDSLIVQAVKSFYDGSKEVDRDEFRVFTAPLLKDRPSLQALKWVPRVPEPQRAEFEAAAVKEGHRGFRITEYGRNGSLVPASRREHFYPILFVEPLVGGIRELGFDLGTEPHCREAMDRSASTGRLVSTPGIETGLRGSGQAGLRFFLPVYRKDEPLGTDDERRQHLEGFVVGVLPVEGIVKEALSNLSAAGVHVGLFDLSARRGKQILLWHVARAGSSEPLPEDAVSFYLHAPLRRSSVLRLADRQWTIACVPNADMIGEHLTWRPWAMSLGALLIAGLLATYLVSAALRSDRTARLARQLGEINRQWESDLAERRRAELSLRTSQTKYKALYDSSADAIMLATPEEGFLSGNAAAVTLFGCKDEEELVSFGPVGSSPEHQPDGEPSPAKAQQMMATAMQEGSHFFEWRHKRADGAEFPATVLLTRMDLEGKAILLATVRDISQQKRAEEQLCESNRHLLQLNRNLAAAASEIKALMKQVVETNSFASRFSNPSLVRCWERKHCGHRACPVFGRDEKLRCWEIAGTFCKGKAQGKFAQKLKDCTQCEIYHAARADPIYDLGETFNEMIAILADRHSAMEQARVAAEAADRAKSAFLANMSHEIRSPMTAILGYADLLADPALSPSTRDNYLAVVRRNGEQLLCLINDILDLSKIEAGKLSLDVQPCSLVAVLADVTSTMRPRAEGRGNSLSLEYAGEVPEAIHTDVMRLRQAVVNLVGNAVKFTENGAVRLRVTFVPEWRNAEPAVAIDVIDTGIGIREDVLPQLFQPFVQGDASVSRKFGGTGLGLTISRHIAELLGGELTVRSTLGQGSTFTLTVPTGALRAVRMLASPAEAMTDSAPEAGLPSDMDLTGIRVLLAEDGFDNQQFIRTVLRGAGAEVEITENGRLAVEAARTGSFGVVLMDMNMPEMDGYQAARILRDGGYERPILALTANAMAGDQQRCLEAGCNVHLAKPIDRVRLIRAIAQSVAAGPRDVHRAPPRGEAPAPAVDAIASGFADDPDMAAILDSFVAGLDGQVRAMHEALARHRYEDLQRAAHRLKGSGGSYGYPTLTDAASALEGAMKNRDVPAAVSALDRVAALCQAIEKGHRPLSFSGRIGQ